MDPSDEPYPPYKNAYTFDSQICDRGNVVVYKAYCNYPFPRAKPLAIKILNLARTNVAGSGALSVLAELINGATFLPHHINITKPLCYFLCEGAAELWVVMPYFWAGSVLSIMTYGHPFGIKPKCIAMILVQIVNALDAIHRTGLIHGGVKPGNIMQEGTGLPKLSDYGVSSWNYDDELPIANDPSSFTATTVPYWLPPETMWPEPRFDHKSDIWSFGITALELFRGRPPISVFPDASQKLENTIYKRFHFSYNHLMPKPPKFPDNTCGDSFKDLVRLCLIRDPRIRPSAEELLDHEFFDERSMVEHMGILANLHMVDDRFKEPKVEKDSPSLVHPGCSSSDGMPDGAVFLGWKLNLEKMELEPEYSAVRQKSPSISDSSHSESLNRSSSESGIA